MDTNRLLSPENVNRQKLMQYAREAADFSTEHRLPQLPFALNHYGREDVAMFDFTCMYASLNAGKVMERHGHKLLLQLVGDSLLEVRGSYRIEGREGRRGRAPPDGPGVRVELRRGNIVGWHFVSQVLKLIC